MPTRTSDGRVAAAGPLVKLGAAATVVGGLLVFAGWALGVSWLRAPLPGVVDMKANTALGFVLCGLALGLVASGDRRAPSTRLVSACGLLVAVLGLATLAQYGLRTDLGIDEALFIDDHRAGRTVHPGRLAPQTGIAFLLSGTALCLLRWREIGVRLAELLSVAAMLVSVLALIAYTYGVPLLAEFPGLTPMAPHTAALCLVFNVAFIGAVDGPIAANIAGPRAGSVMARRLLVLALVAMPSLGWLRLEGERQGLFGAAEGVALMVLTQLMVIGAGVYIGTRALNRAEVEGERARAIEKRLAAIVEASSEAIFGLDPEGVITSWNAGSEKVCGYTAAEAIGRPVNLLAPPSRRDEARALVSHVASGRRLSHHATQRLRKDGTLLDVAITAAPIVEEGVVVGISALMQDVTADNRAKRELEERVLERTAALADSRAETLQRLALAAEYRDDETYRHTERVGLLSAMVAQRLGLQDSEARLLRQAAPLHDIGKLGLPDAILLKRGRLTEDEFEAMKRHTELGARILDNSRSAVLRMAEQIALTHHERWDGSGYPAGRHGEAIPLVGRIVAICDVFDALTHVRPYKPAWSVSAALSEIRTLSGKHFDPRVVQAFLSIDLELFLASEEEVTRPAEGDLGDVLEPASTPAGGELGGLSRGRLATR